MKAELRFLRRTTDRPRRRFQRGVYILPTLFTLLFLLGVLATIFGPLKYSLMPQHLRQSELVGGGLDGPVFYIVHWPEARAR